MTDYLKIYEKWTTSSIIDQNTKNELLKISDNKKEIEDRFYKNLEFGTGGLRGILGSGINRMNIYTVRRATQGLASYINNLGEDFAKKGVVIAFDSRNMSYEFAREAAMVLSANNIKVYLFDKLRPTPELSFAVREQNATAGIVVTASHNPPEYNGYKVYWSDGGQVPPQTADKILTEIDNTDIFSDIKTGSYDSPLINIIGEEIDEKYLEKVFEQSINSKLVNEISDNFSLVYTPIHGSGNVLVKKILKKLGMKNVIAVKEQEEPDGNFPTVKSPNPEEKDCFNIAIDIAKKEGADLIIGTDPDCDRVGVVVKNSDGDYVTLTGNETGVLLLNYILSQKLERKIMPKNPAVIKTIVTTKMAKEIADYYNVEIIDVLTGFKFIGEKIKEFEEKGDKNYIFGFEESYGYLAGTYARDKDAVVASMLIAEMAAFYKSKNMSLYDGLIELYTKFGYYEDKLLSMTLKGIDGMKKIKEIMESFKVNPLKEVSGLSVISFSDYEKSLKRNFAGGSISVINLPKSDVLCFELIDGSSITIRPSGTEPKIKVYFSAKGKNKTDAVEKINKISNEVANIIDKI